MRPLLLGAVIAALAAAGCGDDRGRDVVNACLDHGGVVALDDDVVICRDQSKQDVDED